MADIAITTSHVHLCRVGATLNDGTTKLAMHRVRVEIEMQTDRVDQSLRGGLPPDDTDAVKRMRQWMHEHMEDRDARLEFDFTPDARNFAIYLGRVFMGISPRFAACTVEINNRDRCTVRFH